MKNYNTLSTLSKLQIEVLRQNKELNSVGKVLKLSEDNPYLIKLLSVSEIKGLTEEQINGLMAYNFQVSYMTRDQIDALRSHETFKTVDQLLSQSKPWLVKLLSKDEIATLQLSKLSQCHLEFLRDNKELKTIEQLLNLSKANPFLIKLLEEKEMENVTKKQIADLTSEQIKALERRQVLRLGEDPCKALVTNILVQSYNSSDKTLENFQEKLGEYTVLGSIKDFHESIVKLKIELKLRAINLTEAIQLQDIARAFLAMKCVSKGENLTKAHIQTLESSVTWFDFIKQLVTYLFNCFRTEQKESTVEVKEKFQRFVTRQQDCIGSARAA